MKKQKEIIEKIHIYDMSPRLTREQIKPFIHYMINLRHTAPILLGIRIKSIYYNCISPLKN